MFISQIYYIFWVVNWKFPRIGLPLVIIRLNRIFPNKNHPAMGVAPWLWKPSISFMTPILSILLPWAPASDAPGCSFEQISPRARRGKKQWADQQCVFFSEIVVPQMDGWMVDVGKFHRKRMVWGHPYCRKRLYWMLNSKILRYWPARNGRSTTLEIINASRHYFPIWSSTIQYGVGRAGIPTDDWTVKTCSFWVMLKTCFIPSYQLFEAISCVLFPAGYL